MATFYCDSCLNEKTSKAIECEELICEHCVKVHQSRTPHHLVNVDILPTSVLTSNQYCEIHTERILDLFCTQDDMLICRSCMPEKHRNCYSVIKLEDASRNIDDSSMLIATKSELNGIANTIGNLEQERKSTSTKIEDDASFAASKVANLKDRMLKRIDEMEQDLLTEIKDIKRKHLSEINSTTEEIQEMKNKIDYLKQNLKTTGQVSSKTQKFVMIHSLKPKISELQDRLQHILSSTKSVDILFSPTMNILPSQKMGLIQENTIPYTIVHHISNQIQAPIIPKKPPSFIFTKEFNLIDSMISSSVIIQQDMLLVCFFDIPALGVVNEDGMITKMQKLTSKPWNIAIIPNTGKAMVSLAREKSIQYVKIKNLELEKKVSVEEKFPSEIWGIAVRKGRIALGSFGKVYLCNMNLDVLIDLTVGAGMVYYLNFDKSDRLYCVIKDTGEVYRFLKTGKLSFKYSLNDYPDIGGIASDKYGNLMITDGNTNSIIEISSEGKKHRQILEGKDGIKNPAALFFNKTFTKLFVLNSDGSVTIFECCQNPQKSQEEFN